MEALAFHLGSVSNESLFMTQRLSYRGPFLLELSIRTAIIISGGHFEEFFEESFVKILFIAHIFEFLLFKANSRMTF